MRGILLVAMLVPGVFLSAEAQEPDSESVINADQLIQMVGDEPGLVIIDSRLKSDRKRGFIEGSIALTDTDTTCSSLAKIAPDRKRPLVFYCSGPKCKRSKNAIAIAKSCGYQRLFWFRGGFEEWVQNKYIYNKNE